MKNLNNYLYITDESIQELKIFNESRLCFKYGKGRSEKHDVNKRTEHRLNLNKPHPGYEKTYFCETQKEYTLMETYVLDKLRKDERYMCIKTDTITGIDSEFFWIKEKCIDLKQLAKFWFELSNTIEKYHFEFKTFGEDVEIEDEKIQDDNYTEETEDLEEVVEKVISFNDYNPNTMSLKGSSISGTFNTRNVKNWNHFNNMIGSYVYEKCDKKLDDANSHLKITLHRDNTEKPRLIKNIDYDFYHYNVNAEYTYKNAKYVQEIYNLNFNDLLITLS